MLNTTRLCATLALPVLLASCSGEETTAAALAHPDETGVLKVSTRNGSTTYYTDRFDQPAAVALFLRHFALRFRTIAAAAVRRSSRLLL